MILLLALVLDLALGEPPNRLHPVAWVGRLLAIGFRIPRRAGPARLLLQGGAVVGAVAALAALVARVVERRSRRHRIAGVLAQAMILKSAFSLRRLLDATMAVGRALARGDLEEARRLAGRDLVSRETSSLGPEEIASAAIESVAENLTDSVAAPLLYYVLAGTPGAWAYRVINTADAMVGYRGGRLEYLGKLAARLDDVLNLVPARASAAALTVAAAVTGADGRRARAVLSRDHGHTTSPNAGWTMAAMAGALGVTLAKRDTYRLGDGPAPSARDVARAVHLAAVASALIASAAVGASLLGGPPALRARGRAFSSV